MLTRRCNILSRERRVPRRFPGPLCPPSDHMAQKKKRYVETGNGLVVFHSKECVRKGYLTSWSDRKLCSLNEIVSAYQTTQLSRPLFFAPPNSFDFMILYIYIILFSLESTASKHIQPCPEGRRQARQSRTNADTGMQVFQVLLDDLRTWCTRRCQRSDTIKY